MWLASALAKIHNAVQQIRNPEAEAVPAMAPLFIVNPLTDGGMDNFFSTHPNVENRIAELEKLAQEMAASAPRQRPFLDPEADGPWARRSVDNATRPRGPWDRA
jgi:heat shock protein HtpX